MNRRRFLSCVLVPLVPVPPAAAEPVFIGFDCADLLKFGIYPPNQADQFVVALGTFVSDLNAAVRRRQG